MSMSIATIKIVTRCTRTSRKLPARCSRLQHDFVEPALLGEMFTPESRKRNNAGRPIEYKSDASLGRIDRSPVESA